MRRVWLLEMLRLLQASLLVAVLAFAGCATTASTVSDRLYFGREIPGGGSVSEAQWNAFVAEVVTPRFPDGFTVWRSSGHWKGDDGVAVSEDSCVLEIVHPVDAASEAKLTEIAQAYRQRFNQEAVMGVRTSAKQTLWRR